MPDDVGWISAIMDNLIAYRAYDETSPINVGSFGILVKTVPGKIERTVLRPLDTR